MNTLDLTSTVSKIFKGYGFKGDVRARIEKRFEDNDWLFLAKTIRNDFRSGEVHYAESGLKDLAITLLILSRVDDVNQKYKYSEFKDILKDLRIIAPLWSSFLASDREFLYRRALESINVGLAVIEGSDLSGWCSQMDTAAMCVLAILHKMSLDAPKEIPIKAVKAQTINGIVDSRNSRKEVGNFFAGRGPSDGRD